MNYLLNTNKHFEAYKIISSIELDLFTAYRCMEDINKNSTFWVINAKTKKAKEEVKRLLLKTTGCLDEKNVMMGNFRVITESEYYKIMKESNENN